VALDRSDERKQLLIREISRKFHEYQEAMAANFIQIFSHENVTHHLLKYSTIQLFILLICLSFINFFHHIVLLNQN